MKNIRKISIVILLLSLVFVVFGFPVSVFANGNAYSNYGSTYTVKEVIDERDLGYGVKFHRELSALSADQNGITNGISGSNLGRQYAQQVNVLEITPSDEVQLVPYAFIDGGNWIATSVRKAALQYEATHPGYRVLAAVNGDYFKISESQKASTGVTIGQGEYYKSISNHSGVNTIAIKNNGEGKQLFTTSVTENLPFLTIYDKDDNVIKKVLINKVNEEPGDSEIALYYATRTAPFGDKLNEQKAKNVWLVNRGINGCTTIDNSFYGVGVIKSFETETNLVSSQFAIASNNKEVSDLLGLEVKIRCQYEYVDPSVEGIENFIGFPFKIIENNQIHNADQWRHPRTIIGQKENGEIVLVTVDGRQETKGMYGASSVEMAAIMGYYGCVDAWNLDGGGSTTMIVRKQEGWDFESTFYEESNRWYVCNSPSDSSERSDGNHLLVVVKLPEVKFDYAEITENYITLNAALLTDINKYTALYVFNNGKFFNVVDGQVKVTGLKRNTEYEFKLYGEKDGQIIDLMISCSYHTNKQTPAGITAVKIGVQEKNGEKYILIRYTVEKNEAIKTIVFVADQRYLTVSNSILIPKTDEFYKSLNESIIEINYSINNVFPDEQLIFEDFNIQFDSIYILDEIEFSINDFIGGMFE